MVFLRKKKADTKNLLGSKRNDRNGKNAAQSDRAFSKRFFGKNKDDAAGETPPPSPESPLNVMVVTTASSSHQKSSQREGPSGDNNSLSGSTISDLSQSVIQRHSYYSNPVEIPEAYPTDKELPPPSYGGRQTISTNADASYGGTFQTNYTTVNTATSNGRTTSGFSSDATQVVTNLLGMFDDACKGPFSSVPQVQCSADTSRQATSSPSNVPTPVWGMAPSEDEDSLMYEKREPIEDDSPSPDRSTYYHENFELVLDEDEKKDSTRKRLLAWVRKKKKDDKEATYLAVFGADPEGGGHDQKQAKSSSLVKRMTRALNKIPEEEEEEEVKQETKTPAVTTKVVSESKPRGEPAIEVEKQSTVPQTSGNLTAERKAEILSDIRKVTEAPTMSEEKVSRSRTWASRTRSWGLQKWSQDKRKEPKEESSALTRVRSTPARSEGSPDHKPAKPMWKSVVDQNSGRTYYYHRFTRQTTWTKPDGFDDQFKVKRSRSITKDAADKAGKEDTGGADWRTNTAVASTLRTSIARGSPEAKKKEIRRLLMDMAPPDPSSVDQLIEQYEGREDELLTQLRDLVQSQPFDEPLKNTGSFASSADFSPTHVEEDEVEESRDVVLTSLPVIQSASMKARTRTAATHTTGQTSRTDKTQKISNVLYGKDRVDSIAQASEANTSLTSLEPPLDAPVLQPDQNPASSNPAPTKRAVIRNRELQVEEFTSNRYGLRTEKYSGNAVHKKSRKSAQQQRVNPYYSSKSETEDDSRYLADNDEPYHYDTDSISALSVPESDFMVRKEKFEASRRKTLDDAIQNQDWELAAVVTEDMRGISFDSTEASSAGGPGYPRGSQFYEWTQSELDKFISENDWDAVARYIAHMRDANNAKSSKATKSRKHETRKSDTRKRDTRKQDSPRKAVGARSRLQQEPTHMRRSSSLDPSESSYYSDDYSSGSSFSSEELKYRKRKEFRC